MHVGKATALTAALAVGAMLAGVRSNIASRAESANPQTISLAVKQLRPFLNKTAHTDGMAQGFDTPEDFAATVHAASNIRVPFAELKHQVVDEGKSLPAAIHALKPTADASLEADLARSEAKADFAAIQ
jgi:type IV secretory pathway TrbL component